MLSHRLNNLARVAFWPSMQTLLLCWFVALLVQLQNGSGLWLNFGIALGYGLPILFTSLLLDYFWPQMSPQLSVALSLLAGLVLGSLSLYWIIYSPFGVIGGNISTLPSNLFLSAAISVICLYYFYSRNRMQVLRAQLSEQARDQAEQERAMVQSQLQTLQSQIEPHFLFNTLANIQVLVDHRPKEAKEMLAALTQLLRANLHQVRKSFTTLAEELSLIRSYLAIQQIRMADRLSYQIELEPGLEQQALPPFLLQPLIENALKHGLEPKPEGGELQLRFYRQQQQVVLEVKDNGLGAESNLSTKGQGIALANIEQRLQSLYRGAAQLVLQPQAHGFTAIIYLPESIKEAE